MMTSNITRHPVRGAARSGALQTRDLSQQAIPDQRSSIICCSASGMTLLTEAKLQ
jgi:hypothetical protein